MKKQVKSLKEISLLGKSLDDLADEIVAGRNDAVAGILKMAHAYAEGLRRFPGKAEEFFKTDPRTRWLSKDTRNMLLMVASKDLDPRVVLIPEPNIAGFIKEIPYKEQQKLLDQNPYVSVVDTATGKVKDVSYIDVTSRQTKIAWDHANQRFRTPAEQRTYLAAETKTVEKKAEEWKPYTIVGNIVRFTKGCELGRNQVIELVRSMGVRVDG